MQNKKQAGNFAHWEDKDKKLFIVAYQGKHEPQDVWYIDSGASRHMTGKKEWF